MIKRDLIDFPLWMLRCSMLVVIGFILYAGFYPFTPLTQPSQTIWALLCFNATHKVFLFDILQNLLFFLPLGFVGAMYSIATTKRVRWLLLLVLGLCVSTFVEITQSYLPMRVPSLLDIVLNAVSTGLGILVYAGVSLNSKAQIPTRQNFKLIALLLFWLGSQLAPWLPSLHPLQMQQGLSDIEYSNLLVEMWPEILSYGLQGLLLVWLSHCLGGKQSQKVMAAVMVFFALGQIIVLGHHLQIAPIVGLFVAVVCSQFQWTMWFLSVTALRLILGMSIAFLSLLLTPWQVANVMEHSGSYSVYLQYFFWWTWLVLGICSDKRSLHY